MSGNLITFNWSRYSAPGRAATSHVIEAGSFVGGSNLAQLTIPSTGQSSQSFSVTAPPGGYWVRMRGINSCGADPTSQEVLVTLGEGALSLSGRWKGVGIVACASDPLCRNSGEILWILEIDLRQTGSSVAGTYYFEAEDAPTSAPASWGLVTGTINQAGSLNLIFTARGPAPFGPNPGGTFSGILAGDFMSIEGTLFPIPQRNIPVQTPRIQLRRG